MVTIADRIKNKLKQKHNVEVSEVYECLANLEKQPIEDTSEGNITDPLSIWFVSETNYGRKLKIVIYPHPDGTMYLKTAYEANQKSIQLFNDLNKT